MMAIIHIQNTAPGPPTATAMATPATLPVPTLEAAEMVKALKAEIPFCPSEISEGFSTMALNMSGMYLICTRNVVMQNQIPDPIRTTMTSSHSLSFTAVTALSKDSIRETYRMKVSQRTFWQRLQKWLPRFMKVSRVIGFPHRAHGLPACP